MTERDYTFEVAVYLRGDALDPNHVSELLGVAPSKAQYKGETRQTSTNQNFVTKIGLWALVAQSKSSDLFELIDELTSKIKKSGVSLLEIDGVQEAYADVFIAMDADEDGEGTCEFQLTPENLKALDCLGIPTRFTVAVVKK